MKRQQSYTSPVHPLLAGLISLVALADGVLHFLLDIVLFHGRFWGAPRPAGPRPGPAPSASAHTPPRPPGPPHHLPLPLNELFLLNALGYVALVVAFWVGPRWLGRWSWVVDLGLIIYTLASIVGWLYVGGPNPQGLGYLSKGLEILLILFLVTHIGTLVWRRGSVRSEPAHEREQVAG